MANKKNQKELAGKGGCSWVIWEKSNTKLHHRFFIDTSISSSSAILIVALLVTISYNLSQVPFADNSTEPSPPAIPLPANNETMLKMFPGMIPPSGYNGNVTPISMPPALQPLLNQKWPLQGMWMVFRWCVVEKRTPFLFYFNFRYQKTNFRNWLRLKSTRNLISGTIYVKNLLKCRDG